MKSLKEIKISELQAQVEALKTMPEGQELGDGMGRKMKESRRDRYIREGEECLRNARYKNEEWFVTEKNRNLLFSDFLMD